MEIKSITINAESSKNYQKYCFSITAENVTEADVETLKKVAIKESIKGINELAGAIGETKTTVSTTGGFKNSADAQPASAPRQPALGVPTYRPRSVGTSNYQSGPKPITDAQMRFLIGYGYEESQINKNGDLVIDKMNEKYGSNSILKASSLLSDSTIKERNKKIGGHNA